MNTTPPSPLARPGHGEERRAAAIQLNLRRARRAHAFSLIFVALALVALTPLPARALAITLPIENVRLADSPLPGAALATALCHTCHAAEYVLYQPPTSPRTYWQATVPKMQKTFAAPIPDDAVTPIVDYLVTLYGVENPPAPPTPAPAQPAK